MENPTVKIRALKRKDRKTLAGMIRKLADKIGDTRILNLMVSDSEAVADDSTQQNTSQFSKIGIEVVKLLIDVLETDVSEWFADLLGCSVDELDDMAVDIELDILDQLFNAEESNRFFTSALRLSKKMRDFAGQFPAQKQE